MGARIMILGVGVGSGHNMAAQALQDAFRRQPAVSVVERVDVLDTTNKLYRKLYDDAYFELVGTVPWLVEWGYDSNDAPFDLNRTLRFWDRVNTTATVKALKGFAPDIVVCTHFLPARLVALMLARGSLDATLAVVTTDYDFQGLWLTSPFTHFFVARHETKAHMAAIGVPSDRIEVSGIPVRGVLGEPVDHAAVRARFGLTAGQPVVLISAGAAGGSYTKTIVQQVLRITAPFQAVIVCGRNDELRREIQQLVGDRHDQFTVLGYTTEMADLMRIASLFVGKPGGLSSSECMAAGLPMVLINPIPGQEERNSDFLLEEGAAVRCNYTTTIGYKIESLLTNPERMAGMAAAARRVGFPDASTRIASEVSTDRVPPLWISNTAQRSMLVASEQGIAATELPAGRRLRTLVDSDTGFSLGVITETQADLLRERTSAAPLTRRALVVSSLQLSELRRRRADADLLLTVRRLLASAPEKILGLA
ncbi:MAG TPA: glycosyltransferase [Microlunatus sp.]|nr:glycosyltransferase [Microlunatus sp.]